MISVLLTLWLALIGADRIDFFGGKGGFILTPFLVLSAVICTLIALTCIVHYRYRPLKLPPNMPLYLLLATGMILLTFLSVFGAKDFELGLKRTVLLMVDVYTTALIAIVLYNSAQTEKILLRGAYLGIIVMLIFDVIFLFRWFSVPFLSFMYNSPFINTVPPSLGIYAPRLAGMSLDANRGAILLGVYMFLVYLFGQKSRYKSVFIYLALLLIVLSFSRSAAASMLAAAFIVFCQKRRIKFSTAVKLAVPAVVTFIGCVYWLNNSPMASKIDLTALLMERASFSSETSAGIHMAVFNRGFDIINSSYKNLFIGIGFGNAYTVLTDFYRGSEYGNFHSIYLSILAESGVFCLIVFLLMCCIPVLKMRKYTALIIGLMLFNVFYQLTLEPMFWFCLAICWANSGFSHNIKTELMDTGTG